MLFMPYGILGALERIRARLRSDGEPATKEAVEYTGG
jgi:hypothetical protein